MMDMPDASQSGRLRKWKVVETEYTCSSPRLKVYLLYIEVGITSGLKGWFSPELQQFKHLLHRIHFCSEPCYSLSQQSGPYLVDVNKTNVGSANHTLGNHPSPRTSHLILHLGKRFPEIVSRIYVIEACLMTFKSQECSSFALGKNSTLSTSH